MFLLACIRIDKDNSFNIHIDYAAHTYCAVMRVCRGVSAGRGRSQCKRVCSLVVLLTVRFVTYGEYTLTNGKLDKTNGISWQRVCVVLHSQMYYICEARSASNAVTGTRRLRTIQHMCCWVAFSILEQNIHQRQASDFQTARCTCDFTYGHRRTLTHSRTGYRSHFRPSSHL